MSYILDALRRADAERERGAVPGLQSTAQPVADDGDLAAPRAGWWWPAAGLGLLLAGGLAWWALGHGDAPPTGAVAPPAMPALPPPAEPPAWPPAAAPASPPPAMPPPVAAALPTVSPNPPPSMLPAPRTPAKAASVPPAPAAPMAAPAAALPAPPALRAAAAAPAVPAATSAAAPARLPTRNELPEELRRQLPPLAVGGSMYSENADKRMLILDGRLLREGESLGNGLELEQIRARSAVLRLNGQRFELGY